MTDTTIYIVIATENHPDREKFICGTFTSEQAAMDYVKELDANSSNWNYDHKLFDHDYYELVLDEKCYYRL